MSERVERIGKESVDDSQVRGICPVCRREVVSNTYYVSGRGYIVLWECIASLKPEPECAYRRVL